MMLIFDEENIKDIVGELVYKQGLDMYYRNKVRRIEIIENSKDEFSVTSIVESAYNLKDYRVVILINKDNGKVEFSCNCNDFSRNRCCKHIAAVFIKINRDKINGEKIAPIFRNYGIELLNHYKEELINEEEPNEIINMEATLYIDNNAFIPYSIELKLGVNRLYIVKNLKELINSIFIEKNPIYFGKEFEFNPKVHCFSEKDYKLLSLLEEIYYNEKQVSKDYYSNKPIFFSGKKAYLTEAQMIKLLNLKDEKYINIKYKNKEFDSIKVCVQNLPLDFYLSFSGEIFKITLQQKLPQAIDKGNKIYIYEDKLYIPSESQTRDFKPIYEIMKKQNSNTIEFSKNHIQEVATYVIPKVRSICRNLTRDETLVTIFQEEPLKIEFYLDRYEDYIICDVLFNYGIKSFSLEEKSANAENVVLIRNIKEENKALKALEVIGFKRDKSKYYLKEEERVMNFIIEGIKTIMNLGEVYYSDNFKSIKIMSPKSFTASIGVNNSNLLEFDFEVEGADKSELKSLFNSLKHRKKYHKLKDGSILPLNSEHINNFNTLIENLDIDISKIDEGRITLPKYASLYIDESIEQNNLGFILRNKTFMDLINSIRDINNIDYKLPQNLSGNLRDYQKIGFKWFKTLSYCDFGGILGDEMGLGKTFQAITYILSEKEENNLAKPALVVCPTSLVYNWLNEFEKFAQHIDVLVICGSKNERLDQMEQIAKHDVIITSYPLIRRDIEEYRDMYFSICILDEAQQIKNPSSLNAQSVKEINAIKRFALTGTPIENSITELWSIFDFIMPGYLKSHSRFVKRFEVPIIKENNKAVLEELLKLIRPFILRRFKKDVALELPPKIEHKVVVDMTEEQKKLYASYANSFKEEIIGEIKERGFNRSKIKILSLLTRLRQICCDPSSFLENYDGDSGKYIALQEILEESIANGHRILLFSQFTTILNNIKERLVKLGISSLYLDGSVPSSKRLEMVDEFNEGETKIFLISLKAGGTGLNLTGADLVIHFDPWWNPAVEDQAVDRAHRIGQTKTVEVIKLITKGTIEEKIYDLQERKKQIIETVLDGERHENIILSKMTEEDVEELFK